MLNPKELEEYFERENLSEEAINVILRIRNMPPERRVESGDVSVACRFSSNKMKCTIQAESHTNELPAVINWEFDENTYEFWDQPQKLKVTYINKTGKKVTHLATYDYFLLQKGFAGWVECKPEEILQKSLDSGSQLFIKDELGNWRCPAGEAAAAEFGLKFVVRSSSENNSTYIRNLTFLADYIDARCPAVSDSNAEAIYKVFKKTACHELRSLIDQGFSVDDIYKMLVDQQLYFDIHTQLLARTHLTLIYRDKATYEALKLHVNSQKESTTRFSSHAPVVGDTFIWDGVAWTILNAGTKSLHIRNAENIIHSIEYSVFKQMVLDGTISQSEGTDSAEDKRILDILMQASPASLTRAAERYLQLFPDESTLVTTPKRTLGRWRNMYRHAESLYGNGYIGLLSNTVNRGNRNAKIDQRVLEIADEVIKEFYLKPNGRSPGLCWGEVELRCSKEGLVPPSEKTLGRLIKQLSSNDVKRTREGKKAAYSQSPFVWYLDQTSARHGDRAFEVGHIDHTELDLQLVDSKTGVNLGKVWLTVLLDAYTRVVLAWVLSFDSPSYRSCMAVIQNCVERYQRVPKYFVLDQGSEFKSDYFDTLLARLECHKKERPGSKPRFGSVIERFFGVNNQTFIHNLQGHNKPLQNPRVLSGTHDPRKLAIWTLPVLKEAFGNYIENAYSKMVHAALGVSPETAMAISLKESGHRPHKIIPYTQHFIFMCWPSVPKGTAKVLKNQGVKINYIYYWTPEFNNPRFVGRDVPVRYDPHNVAYAAAWLEDHWAPLVSEYSEYFEGMTEKQINTATKELRVRLRNEPRRRAINAQILAAFFRDITKTEQGLTDQLRHLESIDNTHINLIAPELDLQQLPNPNTAQDRDVWADINTRAIGEFEL
jgi:transposase InsO family protein